MSFQKYANYKDSGTAWLGKIPVGWTTKKLKFVATIQPSNVDKKSKENEERIRLCNYTDVYYNEEITADLPFMKATASDAQIRKFTLKKGDIIITKDSEDPNDIAVPAYVPQDLQGVVCGYHLALLRPKDGTFGGYLKRVMDSRYARSFFATRANGITRYGLGIYAINNFILPIPPLEEQQKIAAFLDRETAQIAALIDEQTRLIDLLGEKRQAVISNAITKGLNPNFSENKMDRIFDNGNISNAITKGLNPNAKMKDSGIEWIGEIPAHWEVKKLKHVCARSGLYGANIAATHYRETGIRFLRTTDITDDGKIRKEGVFLPEELVRDYILNDGDILLSRSGTVGRSFLYQSKLHGPCSYAGYLVRFVPNPHTLPKYVFFYTKTHAFERFLRLMAISATIENVNADKYANAHLPVPPFEEQKEIADYLDRETKKIDALVETCETAIGLLKERRTALISAAVTGNIDVRNVG